jgi:hypothetical protein
MKRQLPLQSDEVPLIDADLSAKRRQAAQLTSANQALQEQMEQRIRELDYHLSIELKDVAGTYPDEVSLLG